ncbi:MAG: RNase adapter RapZ [Lysobacterales bacterium]|jgi:UPF0042 nucleotide-binding protein
MIVSGLSGAGKSTALNALEDLGYYCIDNLPPALLEAFPPLIHEHVSLYERVALGIDARVAAAGLERIPSWMDELKDQGLRCELLFLQASRNTLIKRFSETRRKHPLSKNAHGLAEAVEQEVELLAPLKQRAGWVLDSTDTNIHQLRRQVWKYVGSGQQGMTIVLQSFAFKRGVPQDVDFVFDARSLPNPHWQEGLRELTGLDPRVRDWLEQEPQALELSDHILEFLGRWLPRFEEAQRSYVTVGVGCTGGKHRSVYLVSKLSQALKPQFPEILIHHRELEG